MSDDKLQKLLVAFKEILPPIPPNNAICHIGICSQEKCGNCSRIIAAHKALEEFENV